MWLLEFVVGFIVLIIFIFKVRKNALISIVKIGILIRGAGFFIYDPKKQLLNMLRSMLMYYILRSKIG